MFFYAISFLAQQTFTLNLHYIFSLVEIQNIATEANLASIISLIWIWLSTLLYAFPNEIYSMDQDIVLKLACPEKVLEKDYCVNTYYVLNDIYLQVFLIMLSHLLKQPSMEHCFLCFILVYEYTDTEVRLSTMLDYSLPHSFRSWIPNQADKNSMKAYIDGIEKFPRNYYCTLLCGGGQLAFY